MAKKYKVITAVTAALIAAVIMIISVSAYTSDTAYFLHSYGSKDYMYVAYMEDEVYVYTPNSSWGFIHDLDFKRYHTYTVDITLHMAFPEEFGDYPLPGDLINVCFLESVDLDGVYTIDLSDILLTQTNSVGVSYTDLVSVSFDYSYYAAGITSVNYRLSFSTSDGFIDTLDEGKQFLFSLFKLNTDIDIVGYPVTFWSMNVSSTYDPEGDVFESTLLDQLGDSVSQLHDLNQKINTLQGTNASQLQQLEALKSQTEVLVEKTTQLYTTVDNIYRDVSALPGKIGDEFSSSLMQHDQHLLDVSLEGGNELMEQLTGAIGGAVDTNGVIDSMGGLINVLSYEGRKSELRIPEMSIPPLAGVTSEPLQLMSATSVDFADYVDMIPESIMTLIQWITVVLIVINAVLTLMKFINQFLQGKSVGGEDGD